MPDIRRLVAILALAALSTGCTRLGTEGEVLLDGVTLLTAEEVRRIGDVESPELGFTRITSLDVDRDGNLYVLEGAVPEIRVLSPEGAIVRRIGRRGEGPGEFAGTPRFGVVGDTVWTWDTRINRITLFDRMGAVISTGRTDGVRIPLPSSFGYVLPGRMRPDGRFTGTFSRVAASIDDPPTGVLATDRIPWPLVLFDPSGVVADTIGWAGRPPPRMWRPPSGDGSRLDVVEAGARRIMVPTAPTTLPWWIDLLDGYITIETPNATSPEDATFTVTRFGVDEDTVYHRTVHYAPDRYTEADLDSIAARTARNPGGIVLSGGDTPPAPDNVEAIARAVRDMMRYPDYWLPIESPWLANDEALWLRRSGGDGPTRRWLILDSRGLPRGEVELPAALRLLWAKGDTLWGTMPDEYDVPWVVEYRIG